MGQEKNIERAIGECLRARDISSDKARLHQVADELRKRLAPVLNGTADPGIECTARPATESEGRSLARH